jgi:hypothetical protein
VDDKEVQDVLRRVGIRVGPEVAAYVSRRLSAAAAPGGVVGSIPVIGGDARTGVAVRKEISVAQFQSVASAVDGYLPFARGQR